MKWLVLPLVLFILTCGCSQPAPNVENVPTPIAVTETWIQTIQTPNETVGPTPTPTNDVRECYNHNVTEYPDYCYDLLYWVRPTYSPPGSGYTARVWKNDGCVDLNRTSGLCEKWGDNTYTEIFMHNQTIIRNLSYINITEVISAASYYNRSFDLNIINGETFDSFISKYWDGTYPGTKYSTDSFAPDMNITIPVVEGTFNPDGF